MLRYNATLQGLLITLIKSSHDYLHFIASRWLFNGYQKTFKKSVLYRRWGKLNFALIYPIYQTWDSFLVVMARKNKGSQLDPTIGSGHLASKSASGKPSGRRTQSFRIAARIRNPLFKNKTTTNGFEIFLPKFFCGFVKSDKNVGQESWQ